MHQDPEHEDYDDDDYNYYPSYNEYGYPKQFDIDWAAWEKWLSKAIKDIVEEDKNVWIVGHNLDKTNKKFNVGDSTHKNISKQKYFMYLGSNSYDESVWKKKYFVSNKLDQQYRHHLEANAVHFLKQPNYYKGLYDNLN